MNLKKTLASGLAAIAMIGGSFAGGFAQSTHTPSTQEATVTVNVDGTFDAQFCSWILVGDTWVQIGVYDLGTHTLTSAQPTAAAEGTMAICYTDTLPDRGVFRAYVQAGDFYGPTDSISATNLHPTTVYNVLQGQWSGVVPGIGDIGGMTGNANYSDGGYVNSDSALWVGGSLSSSQYIGYGNAGIGTGGSAYLGSNTGPVIPQLENGSFALVDIELNVPNTADGGTYTSTFTLNIHPWAP